MSISENYARIRKEIPSSVRIVAAAKGRSLQEIEEVIDAGATDIGENYIQEAVLHFNGLGARAGRVKWHLIGKLQSNKIRKSLGIFDVIQTVDSIELAEEIDRIAGLLKKIVSVYIEVNISKEKQKSGIMPEETADFAEKISNFKNLKLKGLMAMGSQNRDVNRQFLEMRKIFECIKSLNIMGDAAVLSMGMSDS
ncbi:MAG: YggS family pyridoxal phosphate-dependent enzyme, partial [archaeon]